MTRQRPGVSELLSAGTWAASRRCQPATATVTPASHGVIARRGSSLGRDHHRHDRQREERSLDALEREGEDRQERHADAGSIPGHLGAPHHRHEQEQVDRRGQVGVDVEEVVVEAGQREQCHRDQGDDRAARPHLERARRVAQDEDEQRDERQAEHRLERVQVVLAGETVQRVRHHLERPPGAQLAQHVLHLDPLAQDACHVDQAVRVVAHPRQVEPADQDGGDREAAGPQRDRRRDRARERASPDRDGDGAGEDQAQEQERGAGPVRDAGRQREQEEHHRRGEPERKAERAGQARLAAPSDRERQRHTDEVKRDEERRLAHGASLRATVPRTAVNRGAGRR